MRAIVFGIVRFNPVWLFDRPGNARRRSPGGRVAVTSGGTWKPFARLTDRAGTSSWRRLVPLEPFPCLARPVVLSGTNRLNIARDIGLKTVPVIIRDYPDARSAKLFAVSDNLARRRLTAGQRAYLALQYQELLAVGKGHRTDLHPRHTESVVAAGPVHSGRSVLYRVGCHRRRNRSPDKWKCPIMSERLLKAAMAWMAACAWLAAGSAGRLHGAEKTVSLAGAMETPVFNVRSYGAVGDDKTDNTKAFSACLKAVIDAGGGRICLPAGVYRGRIIIPAVEAPRWISLEIVGESQPASGFGTVGRFEMRNSNTIVKNVATIRPRGHLRRSCRRQRQATSRESMWSSKTWR